MSTLPHPCLDLQTTETPQPSVPSWFAETVLIAEYLRTHGLLQTISDQVRLVRGRFARYEVIDFLVLLFGYAISGERTLQAYFTRLAPVADSFMALFERDQMPHRSTLSRFLGMWTMPVSPHCDPCLSRPPLAGAGHQNHSAACGIAVDSTI